MPQFHSVGCDGHVIVIDSFLEGVYRGRIWLACGHTNSGHVFNVCFEQCRTGFNAGSTRHGTGLFEPAVLMLDVRVRLEVRYWEISFQD